MAEIARILEDDEIILDDEGLQGNKKPPKPKKIKPPKAPKGKKGNEKKSVSVLLVGLCIFFFFVLLNAVAYACIYFDVGGVKQPVNDLLNLSDIALTAEKADLEEREDKLKTESEQVLAERARVEGLEKEVKNRETSVARKEKELTTKLAELDAQQEAAEQQEKDIVNTVTLLEMMDVDAAISILTEMPDKALLYKHFRAFSVKKQAEFLAKMDVELANEIIAELNR